MPPTPTLFPAPVCPATRRCGMRARSATIGSPCTSMPSAIVRVDDALHTELQALHRDQLHRPLELLAVALAVALRRGTEILLGREDPAVRLLRRRERKDALRSLVLDELRGPRDRPGQLGQPRGRS